MTDAVYIISAVDPDERKKTPIFYKIGISNDPLKRLSQLQTSCPLKLILLHYWIVPYPYKPEDKGARDLETALHKKLAPYRTRGEWFGRYAIGELQKILHSNDINTLLNFCEGY